MIGKILGNARVRIEDELIRKIVEKYNEELWREYNEVKDWDPAWLEVWQLEGADGVGKSTFAKELAKRANRVYVHYPLNKEVILKYLRGEIRELEKDLYCIFEIVLRRHIAFSREEQLVEDRGLLSTYIYTKLPTSIRIAQEAIRRIEANTKLAVLTHRYNKEIEDKNDTLEEYERINRRYVYEFYNINQHYRSAKLYLSETSVDELLNYFTS